LNTFPDGREEIVVDGVSTMKYKNGIVKITYPNGFQETRWPTGQVRLKDGAVR
jgi:phage terminase large subunit-like protein